MANLTGLDCNRIDFNAYCPAFPTGEFHRMLAGCNCILCGRPRMIGSVTEGWSHDEGGGGRSVPGVHGSVSGAQSESVTGGMEMQCVSTEVYRVISSRFSTMYCKACKYGFMVY